MMRVFETGRLIALSIVMGLGTAGARAEERPLVIGYFAAWNIGPDTIEIADLPADQLTHIAYAFGGVSVDGLAVLEDPCRDAGECAEASGAASGGHFAELLALKRRHPNLKVLISIGGWTGSTYFSDAAASEASRRRFVASAVTRFIDGVPGLFDGIDIDWEFPVEGGLADNIVRPDDRANLTRLMAEFRRQLDEAQTRTARPLSLSIAATADRWMMANLDLERLRRDLDWIQVMTYDYHAGAQVADFNAPLLASPDGETPRASVDASLQAFLDAGVPASQLVMGIPFYGRVYRDVAAERDGLRQPAEPMEDGEVWQGLIDYRDIVARRLTEAGFARFWDDEAQVPWLYDAQERIWISYDDPQSVRRKAAHARERGLRGVMVWELTADDGDLLDALDGGLSPDRVRWMP